MNVKLHVETMALKQGNPVTGASSVFQFQEGFVLTAPAAALTNQNQKEGE